MKPNLYLATGLIVLSCISIASLAEQSQAPSQAQAPAAPSGLLVALPQAAPVPADNPLTAAKIELGHKLFFDARLSRDGKVACNNCHNVMRGGEDGLPVSRGVDGQKGGRSAPTVWNAAFMSVQFWDGRAPSLEEQAKGPIVNPVEMAMKDHDAVVTRLRKIPDYRKEFKAVFGADDSITIDNVARAIASYERSLVTPDSPFDKFISGNQKAISPQAQRGYQLVQTVGCTSCHNGPNFAGPALPQGQGFFMKFPTFPGSDYDKKYHLTEDLGRYNVTKKDEDKNLWRVPTWRNIALTAPYFHNGSVKKLDEAVRVMAKVQLNKTLTEQEVADIVAFLKTLTGDRPKQHVPVLPSGSNETIF